MCVKNTLESKKNNKSRYHLQKCLYLVLHIYYQKKTVALQISWAETYACTHIMHIGILYVSFFQFFGATKCNSTSQVATLQLYKVTTDRYLLLLDPNKTVCTPAEFSYIKTCKAYTTLKFIGTRPIHDSFGSIIDYLRSL